MKRQEKERRRRNPERRPSQRKAKEIFRAKTSSGYKGEKNGSWRDDLRLESERPQRLEVLRECINMLIDAMTGFFVVRTAFANRNLLVILPRG